MIRQRSATVAAAVLAVLTVMSCASGMSRADLAAEYFNIGNAFLELDRADRAAEYFLRALDLDPSLRVAEFNLARAYITAHRYSEAQEILEQLLERDSDNTLLLRSYGYVLYRRGMTGEAAATFERVLEINPSDTDAWYNRALLARAQGNSDTAHSAITRARELDSGAPDIERVYALVQFDRGVAGAHELLAEVHARNPDDLEILGVYARSSIQTGDYAQARDLAAELVTREPGNGGHRFLQARVAFVGLEDHESGIVSLRQALERDFDDEEAIATLLDEIGPEERTLVEALLSDFGRLDSEE